jgi:hypothetical protein
VLEILYFVIDDVDNVLKAAKKYVIVKIHLPLECWYGGLESCQKFPFTSCIKIRVYVQYTSAVFLTKFPLEISTNQN